VGGYVASTFQLATCPKALSKPPKDTQTEARPKMNTTLLLGLLAFVTPGDTYGKTDDGMTPDAVKRFAMDKDFTEVEISTEHGPRKEGLAQMFGRLWGRVLE